MSSIMRRRSGSPLPGRRSVSWSRLGSQHPNIPSGDRATKHSPLPSSGLVQSPSDSVKAGIALAVSFRKERQRPRDVLETLCHRSGRNSKALPPSIADELVGPVFGPFSSRMNGIAAIVDSIACSQILSSKGRESTSWTVRHDPGCYRPGRVESGRSADSHSRLESAISGYAGKRSSSERTEQASRSK